MALNCKIPTPDKYVDIMLDSISYKYDLFNKRVLENSCGEGNILVKIVERYIDDAILRKYSLDSIKVGLQENICGYDTDAVALNKCRERLDGISQKYNIFDVKWNLKCSDVLSVANEKYDYILSNPPYITHHDLSESQREMLKKKYVSCREGRFDYYYAFLEHAILHLKDNGKMSFLIPNNIMKNVHAQTIREILISYVDNIIDLTKEDVFGKVVISPIILTCCMHETNSITIVDYSDKSKFVILKQQLSNKWSFFVDDEQNSSDRFGDYFKVSNSVATLNNNIFILDEKNINSKFESGLLFKAVSPKSIRDNKRKIAIFPYQIIDQKVFRIKEDFFEKKYPNIYEYLRKNKGILKEKNAEKGSVWYEYGRSQALSSITQEKLLIPMVFSGQVNVSYSSQGELPYAGYYITKLKDVELDVACKILRSKAFESYLKKAGTKTSRNSYRISCKDIEDFRFDFSTI